MSIGLTIDEGDYQVIQVTIVANYVHGHDFVYGCIRMSIKFTWA